MAYKKITPLYVLCKRLKKVKEVSRIIVATTKRPEDKKIVNFCKNLNISCFRGSNNNVLTDIFVQQKNLNLKK